MKTESEIILEYETAVSQADSLEHSADEMSRTVHGKIMEIRERLAVSWQGEGAEAFQEKCAVLSGKSEQACGALREIGGAIRTIAQNIYNAEMRSLEIARMRDYT